MTYVFKDHVKIVKVYMVKFNVSILNRLKTISFFVGTKYINKYNVSLNKTVTKLCTILTECFFFPYLNPASYLKLVNGMVLPERSTAHLDHLLQKPFQYQHIKKITFKGVLSGRITLTIFKCFRVISSLKKKTIQFPLFFDLYFPQKRAPNLPICPLPTERSV